MSAVMFKAIVRKELREHLKWAVIVLLGMAAVLAYVVPSYAMLGVVGGDLSRIFNTLAGITTIGGLLAGLLIGAAQTVGESRGDKWGFLVHRPIGRTPLFWGKVMAGTLLYFAATGLPVIAALLWIASPGYLPVPFDWRIGLPALANLLAGLVFYFAGLLTGMRQARWYVSRALGIGAAVCCLALQGNAATFPVAVAICAAGMSVVCAAAWGTFIAGGRYGVQPVVGRMATAASIGSGIALVGSLVVVILLSRITASETAVARYMGYTVTGNGVVVRTTLGNSGIIEITDLNGRPMPQRESASRDQRRGPVVLSATLARRLQGTPSFSSSASLYTLLRRPESGDPISWHYVQRLGLITAYDSQSRQLIGWMGPDGFSLGKAKPRPFGGRLNSTGPVNSGQRLLVVGDAVYRFDLANRRVEKVFQQEPGESLLDAGSALVAAAAWPDRSAEIEEFDAISTTRRVIIQLTDGTRLLEAPQVDNYGRYSILQVARPLQAPGTIFLLRQNTLDGTNFITEFNSDGATVNAWTLPGSNRVPKASWAKIAIFSTLTPLIVQALEITKPSSQAGSPLAGADAPARWPLAILSSLISAAAVFLRGRWYAFPAVRLSTWMGVALLFGPFAYLLMLALIEWPARDSCPACSRKRVVNRQDCEHCGAPFPAPSMDGTEIFVPMPGRPG